MTNQLPAHPWIARLRSALDGLEAALLTGDATAVQGASASVQTVLQQAPKTAEFDEPGSALGADMLQAAHRFGQLRKAVLRANAHNQRAIQSLMPRQALPATYGRGMGAATGGVGRAYLSA